MQPGVRLPMQQQQLLPMMQPLLLPGVRVTQAAMIESACFFCLEKHVPPLV